MNEYVFCKTGGKCMNCCGYYLIGIGPPSLKKLRRVEGERRAGKRAESVWHATLGGVLRNFFFVRSS